MKNISASLQDQGCEILASNVSSLLAKCGNSFILKNPNIDWKAFVPIGKLSELRENLIPKSILPSSISVGKMVRGGSWSRMYEFNINNEIEYDFQKEDIEKIDDDDVKYTLNEMKDQISLFNEDSQSFDIRTDFKNNVKRIGLHLKKLITRELKENLDSPVVCHTKPVVTKFWTPEEGEIMEWNVRGSCIVPKSQQKIDNVVDAVLRRGKINKFNKFISSRLSKDDNMFLDGIKLFQKGSDSPFVRLSIVNESSMMNDDFVERLELLEKDFSDKTQLKKIKDLDEIMNDLL